MAGDLAVRCQLAGAGFPRGVRRRARGPQQLGLVLLCVDRHQVLAVLQAIRVERGGLARILAELLPVLILLFQRSLQPRSRARSGSWIPLMAGQLAIGPDRCTT